MKPLHVFLIVLGTLVFLMLGCFLFFCVFIGLSSLEDVVKDIERLYDHRILAGCIGFFFVSVGYVGVKILIKRSNKDELFVVDSEYGRTSISVFAVEDLVKKVIKRYENVKRFKLKVAIQNKVLTITAVLVVWLGKPVADCIEEIQSEIKRKLITFVGLTKENMNIEIKVSKVVESKVKKPI